MREIIWYFSFSYWLISVSIMFSRPIHAVTRVKFSSFLHQTKKFLHSKGNHHKTKRQPTEWENIFTNTSDKELISKIYKEHTKLNNKKTKKEIIKKCVKTLNRYFPRKDIQMANRYMKRCTK